MSPSFVLLLAVVGLSVSGPLVRLSHAHPLTIAVGRVALSMPIVIACVVATGTWRQWRRLDRRGLAMSFAAGTMLALHFWSWNASVGLTTIAASVVLVDTQPLIVAALSVVWLREPPTRRQWVGIAVAVLGAAVVVWPHVDAGTGGATGRDALLGDFLAVVGAVTAAVYYVCGRQLRATLDLWPYVALVYATCLIFLVAFAVLVDAPLGGQSPRELAIFFGLAAGPMLLGHTGLNWALRYLPAYVVNVTVLGEVVGATVLAALLPGIRELPSIATVIGGAVIIGGIYVTSSRRARPASGGT